MNTPGERLRQARLLAGFKSATKAAAAAGMSESSYRAHENGQNAFTTEQAQHYAEVFGCDPVWLLIGPYAEEEDDGPAETVAAVTLSSAAILARQPCSYWSSSRRRPMPRPALAGSWIWLAN